MRNLGALRGYFTKAAWGLGSIATLAALYLLFPVGASTAEAKAELDGTTLKRKEKEKEVFPLRGIQDKLLQSQKDAQVFYRERLAGRSSVIFDDLGQLARDSGVTLATGTYTTTDSEIANITLVELDVQVSGFYPQIAKFIHSVEQSKHFYMIDGLSLADRKGGTVKLDLKVETYLRPPSEKEPESKTAAKEKPAPERSGAAGGKSKAKEGPKR